MRFTGCTWLTTTLLEGWLKPKQWNRMASRVSPSVMHTPCNPVGAFLKFFGTVQLYFHWVFTSGQVSKTWNAIYSQAKRQCGKKKKKNSPVTNACSFICAKCLMLLPQNTFAAKHAKMHVAPRMNFKSQKFRFSLKTCVKKWFWLGFNWPKHWTISR